MRLCVTLPCHFPTGNTEEVCAAIRKSAELGYTAVEAYFWTNWDLNAVRKTLDETGVEFLSLVVPETRMTDPAYRESWLNALREACEAATILGAKRLITQVGNDTGAPREKQHAAIVETLTLAKPILEQYGVTVMPEPLNTKVNHPGYYLTAADEAFAIVREVDSPYVKIVYDIYHQQITEGDIIPTVIKNLDCISHLHAAGHPGRHELWEGELNYKYIFDAIDKAGYTGACGLEYGALQNPVESLRRAMQMFG
jgi:hydroxypyruvate isomerase